MNVFIDEVCTQGSILKGCFDTYFADKSPLEKVGAEFKRKGLKRILFAGMGSSFYAPHCVIPYLSGKGIPASVLSGFDASRYSPAQADAETLVVCVSQSGKSWEVVEFAKKIKGKAPLVGIYNREGSPLSEIVDYHLMINAGEERLISNKSYQCTLAVLNLLAHTLTGELDGAFEKDAYEAAAWTKAWLDAYKEKTTALHEFSKGSQIYDFFADGPSLSTAKQAALIYREGPKVYTAATETADYAHGWDKCAKEGYLGLLFSPAYGNETEQRMVKNVTACGGKIALFTSAGVAPQEKLHVVRLPETRPSLTPLLEIIPADTLMGLMLGEGWTR